MPARKATETMRPEMVGAIKSQIGRVARPVADLRAEYASPDREILPRRRSNAVISRAFDAGVRLGNNASLVTEAHHQLGLRLLKSMNTSVLWPLAAGNPQVCRGGLEAPARRGLRAPRRGRSNSGPQIRRIGSCRAACFKRKRVVAK